jgi:hypothetical protein
MIPTIPEHFFIFLFYQLFEIFPVNPKQHSLLIITFTNRINTQVTNIAWSMYNLK